MGRDFSTFFFTSIVRIDRGVMAELASGWTHYDLCRLIGFSSNVFILATKVPFFFCFKWLPACEGGKSFFANAICFKERRRRTHESFCLLRSKPAGEKQRNINCRELSFNCPRFLRFLFAFPELGNATFSAFLLYAWISCLRFHKNLIHIYAYTLFDFGWCCAKAGE